MVSNALLFLTTLQMPDISSFIWNMQLWFAVEVCQANKSVSMLYKAQHPENPGTHFLRWRKRTMHVLQLQNIKCNIDRVKLIKQIHFRSASQLQQLPEIIWQFLKKLHLMKFLSGMFLRNTKSQRNHDLRMYKVFIHHQPVLGVTLHKTLLFYIIVMVIF